MDAFVLADGSRVRKLAGASINAAMNTAPFHCIGRLGPFTLHPFEIGQPRAILELVDHARRNIRLVRPQRRGRKRKFGLIIHRRRRGAGRKGYSAALDNGRLWSPNPANRPATEMSRRAPPSAGRGC
jgi:hypothetical protein